MTGIPGDRETMDTAFNNRLAPGPLVPRPRHPLRLAFARWTILVAAVIAAGSAVIFGHRAILEGYARLFRVDDPAPSDAIVVLLGGPQARPAHAASLYGAGLAPRVLICNDPGIGPGLPKETGFSVRRMEDLGVPRSAITLVPKSVTSTKEEAEAILPVVVASGMKRITVVTTAFHTARARWIFRKVFRGTGVDIRMAAATDPTFDETNWYRRDESLIVYFTETVKTVLYRLVY